jgi:hypothetical protein
MDLKATNSMMAHSSFNDFNEKYAKIMEKSTLYAYQLQKLKNEEMMFRTNSQDRFDSQQPTEIRASGGNLFISG